ncbi:sulfonate ABC transporter substrate-binding protein [Xylophilus sp. Kf1]|nr:sulfonate ABC transporter substrate-binding protein [Xylophilus sp. Kf1]
MTSRIARLLTAAALVAGATAAHAEGQIRIAQQFGIGYLLLDVVQDQKLIEKHGKALGVEVKVEWNQISGATAMNEALLSSSLDVVSAGVPPMLTLWDRTRGRQNVKAIAALGSLPNYLITNNPRVRTLQDLSDKDRIAVPAAGTGFQSRTLQIEAARRFGKDDFKRFDSISVSLPHPDATAALISGGSEINTHFSSAPFYYQAIDANKAVHKVIGSYEILGGPATFNVLYTTQKYHDENPRTYQAFYAALLEAADIVRQDKARAARIFVQVQKSKLPPDFVRRIVEDPENDFTASPVRTFVYADALYQLGVLKHRATSWKDYFFEEAHARPGS